MIPRVGTPPKTGLTHRLRPGAYAILPLGDRLLLTRQAISDEPLQLPGGGIDPGESPIQALHREVFEETGWRIAAPLRIGAARRFVYMPEYGFHAEKLCTISLARPVRPHGPPREPGHEVTLVAAVDAPDLLDNPVDRRMVRQAMDLGLVR